MRRWLVALGLVLGCGGGSDGPTDPLANTAWASPISGFTCEIGFQFGASSDYVFGLACVLNNGQQAGYIERGDYFTNGNRLTTIAHEASCPPASVTVTATANYSVTSTTLTLSTSTGVTVFQRFTPTPTPGSISIGCFDDQLAFTPFPLSPL